MTNSTDGPAAPDPPPPTFSHVDPTGRRLYVAPGRYRGEPGVWFRADDPGVLLTLPVLEELIARLPVIAAGFDAGDERPA
ncbi:MAG: hypothetical protein JWO98_2459 [Frankiales bacterium]|nr:hypothetical protein [Frankiales bacterium]